MSNVHSTPFALPGAGGAVAGVWPPSQPKTAGASLSRRTGLVVRLPVRSRLYVEGEVLTSTFEVIEGAIMLSRRLSEDRRQIVDIVAAGHLCGHALSEQAICTAETLTESLISVSLGRVDHSDARINQELRAALDRSLDHAVLLGRKTALERVATGIVELADVLFPNRGDDGPVDFHLPLTRSDLADRLGLVLETVSRNLGHLRRLGLIAFQRQDHIVVPSLARLRQVAEDATMARLPADA